MRIPVAHVLGFQPALDISCHNALVTIPTQPAGERQLREERFRNAAHECEAARACETKPSFGFRGIIEDDVSILDEASVTRWLARSAYNPNPSAV